MFTEPSFLNSPAQRTDKVNSPEVMVEPVNWLTELKSCFRGQPYAEWLSTELTRLKEYFTSTLKIDKSDDFVPVLQDGGEINEGVLSWMGPEIWEEFQAGFINKTK